MNNSVTISSIQSQKLGNKIKNLQPHAEDFLNPLLFPSQQSEIEDTARFFFFVTSIDHRTSPAGQSFEGIVNKEYFQGADLLWHLSLRKFHMNPQLFHPAKMARISTKHIQEWYTVNQPKRVTIRNPVERATLFRDGGQRLRDYFESSVLALLKTAQHRISSDSDSGKFGLLQLLSEFKAYEDPASKKSYLFIKFLLRRNLWTHTDTNQVRIPVDNHLTRIALRTGIIQVSPELGNRLRHRVPLDLELDIVLRKKIAHAYSLVGEFAERSVLELDDFFWHFGRQCCLVDAPICETGCTSRCNVIEQLLKVPCQDTCPLASICLAYTDEDQRALIEPKVKTWYY